MKKRASFGRQAAYARVASDRPTSQISPSRFPRRENLKLAIGRVLDAPRSEQPVRTLRAWIGDSHSLGRLGNGVLLTRTSWPKPALVARDPTTGEKIRSVGVEQDVIEEIAVSQDGKTVAIIEEKEVVCRTIPGLKRISRFLVRANHVLFGSPDGSTVITSTTEGLIQRWTATGSVKALLKVGEFWAGDIGITPDGRRFLLAANDEVTVFDLPAGSPVFKVPLRQAPFALLGQVAPDGRSVAVSRRDALLTFSIEGSPLIRFPWGKLNPTSQWAPAVDLIAFSPDSRRLAAASTEGWVLVWDVAEGKLRHVIQAANQPLDDLSFSLTGDEIVLCTAEYRGEYDSDGYVEIWRLP